MRTMTAEQMASVSKRNLQHRAPTDRELQRDRNLEAMRGKCDQHTATKWSHMLGVAPKTVRSYARELGEHCKRAEYVRAECKPIGTKSMGPAAEKRESSTAALMTKWATRKIR